MSYNSTNTGAEIQEKLDKIVAATTLTDGLMSASDKTKLDGLSTNTFLATYGTTTSAECQTAYNAGKRVMCLYNGRWHIMSSISPTNDRICLFECYEYNREDGIFTLYYMYVLDSSWMAEDYIIISKTKSAEVTTLASLPITKKIISASLSAATTMSVSSTMTAGDEIYVVCTPTASFTQPIPNSGSWISMSGSSIAVTSGVPFEISILYDGSYYRVTVKTRG